MSRRFMAQQLARPDPPARRWRSSRVAHRDLRQVHLRAARARLRHHARQRAAPRPARRRCRARRSPRVKIEGALHEFTTIPDVVEDVTDIVLNLKEVAAQGRHDSKPTRAAHRQGRRGQGHGRRHPARRRRRGPQPRPHDPAPARRAAKLRMELHVGTRPRLRAGRAQQGAAACRSARSRSTRCSRRSAR